MEIFASIFSGLGLFFIGIRLIGTNLKQLAGRRMRMLITRAVSGKGTVALFGLAAGAIMQSVNAVTYVLVALVTAGTIEIKRAFPVIRWANIGTSMLVIVAALNMHLLVLVLIGVTGVTYYLNLDQSSRYRHAVGALLGIGLLFLGIDFIKAASSILKGADWFKVFIGYSAQYPIVSFIAGVGVAMLAQSSTTITVVAMAMAASGLLIFESGAMIVLGAGLGSALSAWTLAGRLTGSARQLILYQIALKGLGVIVMLLLFLADWASGMGYIPAAMHQAGLSPSAQLAAVYVLLQIASDLSMRLAHHPVERLIERHAPPSDEETLGRPRYLYDEALAEPESALLLVDKEQQRLLTSLPDYLASLREDVSETSPAAEVLHPAERNILRQCDQFLTDLADRNNSREVLERTIVLRDRNELLGSLQESLIELITVANSNSHAGEVRTLINNLVESLHMMLETLADVAKQPDADDLDMLRMLTHDRSELMDSIRRRMQGGEIAVAAEVQQSVFSATALFERCTWLLRRYVLLLDAPIRQEAVSA
jgi:phosphate:Na+ symporter